jgi:Polysaccharide lyase family 8, C-terminal beta-sandwich domain
LSERAFCIQTGKQQSGSRTWGNDDYSANCRLL